MLDGEFVAWADGRPYFPDVCHRVLNRGLSIPLTFVVFDVLRIEGEDMTSAPDSDRRAALDKRDLQSARSCRVRRSNRGS